MMDIGCLVAVKFKYSVNMFISSLLLCCLAKRKKRACVMAMSSAKKEKRKEKKSVISVSSADEKEEKEEKKEKKSMMALATIAPGKKSEATIETVGSSPTEEKRKVELIRCGLCKNTTNGDCTIVFRLANNDWLIWGDYPSPIDCDYYLLTERKCPIPESILTFGRKADTNSKVGMNVCKDCLEKLLPLCIHLGEYGMLGSDYWLEEEKVDNLVCQAIRLFNFQGLDDSPSKSMQAENLTEEQVYQELRNTRTAR